MSPQKRVIAFFCLFLLVYFLEAIGGFYMSSALVYIEKQFQISSRMSGLMVSAGDFGYIPSVLFVSYFGGKSNRARWIGFGCLMISVANILISSSHFLFPVKPIRLNSSYVEINLERDVKRLNHSLTDDHFIAYFAKNNITVNSYDFDKLFPKNNQVSLMDYTANLELLCEDDEAATNKICFTYFNYLHEFNAPTREEISHTRAFTGFPLGVCNILINKLREQIEDIKCLKSISNIGPFVMIFGGLLLLGVGRTMPFSLGLPLIDDNVQRKNLPLYFALMFFIRILGPVLGLFIGSVTNKYYYTSDVPPGLTPRDPMWIGRWWAGFLIIGSLLCLPSIGLIFFPEEGKKKVEEIGEESEQFLKKAEELDVSLITNGNTKKQSLTHENLSGTEKGNARQQNVLQTHKKHRKTRSLALVDRHLQDENAKQNLSAHKAAKDFCRTVKEVMKSPVYVGALVGRIFDVFSFKGFFVFLPKYLEIQFAVPQYRIQRMMGIIGVAGFAIGSITGSLVMKKFKLQGRKAASWVAVCSAAAALLSFINSTVGCKSALTAMVNCPTGNCLEFNTTCNAGCDCGSVPLYPVCNSLGHPFYSPCHAGCPYDSSMNEVMAKEDTIKIIQNCSCSDTPDMTVSRDFCHEAECNRKFVYYFINMAMSGIFSGLSVVPAVLIGLRSVPPIHRSVSLGFQGLLISALATLPSPVVWGWIVDRTCVLWNTVCGDPTRGACAIYDADKLRVRLHVTYGTMRLISLFTDIWVVYFAKNLILIDDDPVKDEDVTDAEAAKIDTKSRNP